MRLAAALLLAGFALSAANDRPFRAGVARIKITPEHPIQQSGYASRNKPSEGVLTDLWAKAVAIEDHKKNRLVIVTVDLIGLTRTITDAVAARAASEWRLDRSKILFNASHTHTGPAIRSNLEIMFDLDATGRARIDDYAQRLSETLYNLIGAALGDLKPATLLYSEGNATFAANRREFTPKGVNFGVNPKGPVDHTVPVIEVRGASGSPLAILFGYTCHNTTFGGDDYRISGDYAGFAQAAIEERYPGANAMFVMLAGADQNPNPRGTEANARDHGAALAKAVGDALSAPRRPVTGQIRTAFRNVDLAFAVHTRETFEEELKNPNRYRQRRAKAMLAAYDEGHPPRTTQYPIQAVRIGDSIGILALGGEVVIDYQLRVKRTFSKMPMIVAGYSNDVMSYIPSLRILKEGGYEADMSQVYYGMPGPYANDVEDRVFDGIMRTLARVGIK